MISSLLARSSFTRSRINAFFCCGSALDEEQLRACPNCEQLSPLGTTTGFRLRGQASEDTERLSLPGNGRHTWRK
jgi:hypothetical protein